MHARPTRPTIALLVLIAGMLAGCPTSSPPTTITYHPNGGSGAPPTDTTAYASGATPITLYATWRLRATIALGESHTAALLGDGSLCVWGSNAFNALGDSNNDDKSTPTLVPGFPPAGGTSR